MTLYVLYTIYEDLVIAVSKKWPQLEKLKIFIIDKDQSVVDVIKIVQRFSHLSSFSVCNLSGPQELMFEANHEGGPHLNERSIDHPLKSLNCPLRLKFSQVIHILHHFPSLKKLNVGDIYIDLDSSVLDQLLLTQQDHMLGNNIKRLEFDFMRCHTDPNSSYIFKMLQNIRSIRALIQGSLADVPTASNIICSILQNCHRLTKAVFINDIWASRQERSQGGVCYGHQIY